MQPARASLKEIEIDDKNETLHRLNVFAIFIMQLITPLIDNLVK